MANVNFSGLTQLRSLFKEYKNELPEKVDKMLTECAKIVVEHQIASIKSHNLVDTGSLVESIAASEIKDQFGVGYYGRQGKCITIEADGEDERGTANNYKAFALEYGRGAGKDLTSERKTKRSPYKTALRAKRAAEANNGSIQATHWMSEANDAAVPKIMEKAMEILQGKS